MQVTLATIADYASESADGKLSVSGIFQTVNPVRSPLPVTLPILYFVIQVAVEMSELHIPVRANVEVELPDGSNLPVARAELSTRDVSVVAPEMGASFNLVLPLVGFVFQVPGMYVFKCRLEGGDSAQARLYVLPGAGRED